MKTNFLRSLGKKILASAVMTSCTFLCKADEIKHIFIAADESRGQLLYVDQFNPANDWTIPVVSNRDLFYINEERFLASVPGGYREYEVKTGKMIKEVIVKKLKKNKKGKADNRWSVVRRDNGHTFLGSVETIYELDENDTVLRQIKPSGGKFFRLMRMSNEGHFLYTSGVTHIREAGNDGTTIKEYNLSEISPETKKPYFADKMSNGNIVITTGYGAALVELDSNGKLVKAIGGKGKIKGLDNTYFFGQMDELDNGNYVVAHWTGHKPKDSEKAPQVIELNSSGELVWTWHDPKRAGSIHGVIVLK